MKNPSAVHLRKRLVLPFLLSVLAVGAHAQPVPRVTGPGDVNWDTRFGPPPGGLGLNGVVEDFAELPNGDMITVGSFRDAGGNPNADVVARWDGTTWHSLGTGPGFSIAISVVIAPNGDVIVGGRGGVARWNGTTWQSLGSGSFGTTSEVCALLLLPNGDVVAGGGFVNLGGNPLADDIARWDGTTWQPFAPGLNNTVFALALTANGDVVAGGAFVNAGGNPDADCIARWDGTAWQPLGSVFNNYVFAVRVLPDGSVLAGGSFMNASGQPDGVARWDGSAWQPLGAGVGGVAIALDLAPNGDIVAGGGFSDRSSTSRNGIVRWDGTTWQSLGTGVDGVVWGLRVASNNDVFVGGAFDAVGDSSKPMSRIGIYHTPTGVGLPETASSPTAFTLAPNPAHHTVRLTGSTAPTATLLDALGRTVREWPLTASAELDVRGLAPGLYTVRAGTAVRRLVIE